LYFTILAAPAVPAIERVHDDKSEREPRQRRAELLLAWAGGRGLRLTRALHRLPIFLSGGSRGA